MISIETYCALLFILSIIFLIVGILTIHIVTLAASILMCFGTGGIIFFSSSFIEFIQEKIHETE